jgi:hypothetical protein
MINTWLADALHYLAARMDSHFVNRPWAWIKDNTIIEWKK